MLGKNLIQAASGAAGAAGGLGIEDVFSTWLYTGNGSTQTITNGIDLAGEGGMVWIKARNTVYGHYLTDTERGAGYALSSNNTNAQVYSATAFVSGFNADGFSLGNSSSFNDSGRPYASWTFRKAPGFFDVVTFTSNGNASQQIAHNLGSVPGFIILKNLDSSSYGWYMYHRSLDATSPANYGLSFTTAARNNNSGYWDNTQPTSTHFTIGNLYQGNTQNYVAYLFAHDEQIFGESGDQSVIKCGSYTTDGSGNATVNLGWEPQWILVKRSSGTGNWLLFDSMRGIPTGGNDAVLKANTSDAETASFDECNLTATGFQVAFQSASSTYIYIAIRRGPMKTPTSGTEVYSNVTATISSGTERTVGFPADLVISTGRTFEPNAFEDRIRGFSSTNTTGTSPQLLTHSTNAETTSFAPYVYDVWNTSRKDGARTSGYTFVWNHFRRAPGFFDVVAYTGTGVARTVPHNLGVAPELMIVKQRSGTATWAVYCSALGNGQFLEMDFSAASTSSALWNNTTPTSSVFTVGTNGRVNTSTSTYIAYLFASLPGISKVGSYTGNGSVNQIDCGFASGARFVLIKRTDSTGDWYVWDTARGISSGNDPYKLWNSYTTEVTSTDYIDPLSSGFQISWAAPAAINASGGSYIFLAIA